MLELSIVEIEKSSNEFEIGRERSTVGIGRPEPSEPPAGWGTPNQ